MQVIHHRVKLVELALDWEVVEILRRMTAAGRQHIASNGVTRSHRAAADARMLVNAESTDPILQVLLASCCKFLPQVPW